MKYRIPNKIYLFSFFLVLVFFKYLLVLNTTGPIILFDELVYRINAEKLFRHELFDSMKYPPLYSLLLSPAFFSKENWYAWMLFINIIISSSVIYPVWLISIRLLEKSTAWFVVIITGLWSFHVAYPRVVMSENLYVPLFLFSVFLLLETGQESQKQKLASQVCFGVILALAYLTKYIHLVAIPVLIILWWIKPLFREDAKKGNLFNGSCLSGISAILAGFALTYMPWIIYAYFSNASPAQAMGSAFISSGIGDFATLKSLIVWTGFYMSYVVLMLAPYLLVFSFYLFLVLSEKVKQTRQEAFFITAVMLLSGVFLLVSIQHSWRVDYNYPDPKRLMGRYLIQFHPLYLILFMIALNKMKNALHRLSLTHIFLCSLFSLIVILLSQTILFRLPWLHLKFDFINSPDGVLYQPEISIFYILFAVIVITGILMLRFRNENFARRCIVSFSVFLVISIEIISSFGAFQWSIIRNRQVVHSIILADFIKQGGVKNSDKITIIYDIPDASKFYSFTLSESLKFWLYPAVRDKSVSVVPAGNYSLQHRKVSDKLYLLTRSNSGPPLLQYVIRKMRIAEYEQFRKLILDRYPHAEVLHHDQTYYLYDLKDQTGTQHKRGERL